MTIHSNFREAVEAARKPRSSADSWQTNKLRDMLAILGPGNDALAYAMAHSTVNYGQVGDVARVLSAVTGAPDAASQAIPSNHPARGYGNHESAVAAARAVGAMFRGGKQAKASTRKDEPAVSGPAAVARSLRGSFSRSQRMA